MRRPSLLVATVVVLLSGAMAQSSGDWDAVRMLPRETPISVKASRNVKCEFRDATEEQLFCDNPYSGRVLTFSRGDIRQIRRELTTETRGHLGAAVGAAIGAVVGAAMRPQPGQDRATNAAIIGL